MSNYLINYSEVSFYFLIKENLSADIVSSIVDAIAKKDQEKEKILFNEMQSIIENSARLNEYELSSKIFKYIFNEAYKQNVDITHILFTTLLNHDFHFLTDIKGNKENVFAQSLNSEWKIGINNLSYIVKSIIGHIEETLLDLGEQTYFKFAKFIALNTENVQITRQIFSSYLDSFSINQNDYSDKAATIRTLANFGSTQNRAKELINKYLNQ